MAQSAEKLQRRQVGRLKCLTVLGSEVLRLDLGRINVRWGSTVHRDLFRLNIEKKRTKPNCENIPPLSIKDFQTCSIVNVEVNHFVYTRLTLRVKRRQAVML